MTDDFRDDPAFLRDEAIRQARLATGAMREADALRHQLEGAVSLAEVCAFLRSATYPDSATGSDRHPHGYKAAAADLERHFGGQ